MKPQTTALKLRQRVLEPKSSISRLAIIKLWTYNDLQKHLKMCRILPKLGILLPAWQEQKSKQCFTLVFTFQFWRSYMTYKEAKDLFIVIRFCLFNVTKLDRT